MTNRTSSLLFLFVAALLTTGVVSALAVPALSRLGVPTAPWMWSAIALLCYVGVFFAGRAHVLPEPLARPAVKALIVVTAWIVLTMTATAGVVAALRLVGIAPDGMAPGIVLIWFGCLVLSTVLLHRIVGTANRTSAPDRPALP